MSVFPSLQGEEKQFVLIDREWVGTNIQAGASEAKIKAVREAYRTMENA